MMSSNLSDATTAWLNGHLAKIGDLTNHVPRTVEEARKWYLGQTLGVSPIGEPTLNERDIVVRTADTLGTDTLNGLIGARFYHEGRFYHFAAIKPTRVTIPYQDEPLPAFNITYKAT